VLGLASWLFFSFSCSAQDIHTTPNLIQNSWANTVTGNYTPGGTSGGNRAAYNPQTQTILFGYTQQIVNQEIRLREALQGTHLRLYGYNYSFQYMNSEFNRGFVSFSVDLKDQFGFSKQKDNYTLNQTNGWETVSGKRNYGSPFNLDFVDRFDVSFSGKDDRYWAGYYGPQVKNVSLNAMYVVDECTVNPLYASTCPNYQQAYFQSQCNINSLYSPNCQGYAQAYRSQQCSVNVLFSPECPGYESAYLNQQCASNSLFSTACSLYPQAYFNQQCTANPLYNSGCSGYANAFKEKQVTDACKSNSQSSPQCTNYTTPTLSPSQSNSLTDTSKLAETVLIGDPQAQQAITVPSITSTTSPTSQINTSPQLGTGLTVSGITPQPTAQQQRRTQAAQTQRAERARQDPQQQQQAQQVAQMGTVPGFDQYQQVNLPDAVFYTSKEIYRNRTLPDNPRAQRALSQRSDRLHQEMIDEQYRK
jgi:hypothetical protein